MIALCAAFALGLDVEAAPTPEKRADIEKLLKLTNAQAVALEFAATKIDYLLVYARKAKPFIKAEAFRSVRDELLEEMAERVWQSGSFADQVIATWDTRFTHDEIKALIVFYESDVGRKLVILRPEIEKEQRSAGRVWGQEMEAIIADRVRAKLGELEASQQH
ncbi:MAG: hypothetical protein AMS22_01195 [Thiotrichales bacterium SG8_50]|nr:MAG: hypothetical protein AMS22_01195 [Thiotrichales bacterium SG8_50]